MDRRWLLVLSSAALVSTALRSSIAQTSPPPYSPPPYSPEQLDQLLAPIALYPDALLSQVLMAATYPLEVVDAARWSQANPGLKGQDAVNAVQGLDWDVSVKSLVAFPDVLAQMNAQLDWTQKLGDAMIGQQQDVADSIQRLRGEAAAAGNLQSGPQQVVTTEGQGDDIQYVIAPANPDLLYVPVYNPLWAFGRWRYPAFQPYAWRPLPGWGAAPTSGFVWGAGLAVAALLFGGWTWRRGHSFVRITRTNAAWQHDPVHRRGVAYRQPEAQRQYRPPPAGVDQRQAYRGHVSEPAAPPGSQHTNALSGVARGPQVARESQRGQVQQAKVVSHMPPAPQRPAPRPVPPRPAPPPPANKAEHR